MIVVRNVYRLRFGAAKEARALLKSRTEIMTRAGLPPDRHLMDLTGPYYTLVAESTHASLAEFEGGLKRLFADPEWAAWFEKFRPLVASGEREIFTLVDPA